MLFKRLERIHGVALGLGHLLSVPVQNQTQNNDVLIGTLVEEQRRLGHKTVEPASGLVNRLGDKCRRELLFEGLLVLKGIMMLRERHGSGVKPAVDDLRHSLHGLLPAFRAGADELVDIRPVQLDGHRVFSSAVLLQLFAASDADLLSAFPALPDRKRRAPVTVSGDAPVLHILQPVAETAFADGGRDPVHRVVVLDQLILYRGHLDEPGLARVVDQRGVAAPAVRIFVLKLRRVEEFSFLFQILQDHRIRLLDKYSFVGRIRGHIARAVHELDERQVIGTSDPSVILTESRGDMDDTGTVCHGDVIVTGHKMRLFALLLSRFARSLEERLIGPVLEIGSDAAFKNFIFPEGTEHLFRQCLSHDISVTVSSLYFDIGLVRVDAERGIAGQCPGRGRPRQIIEVFLIQGFETDDRGAFLHKAVALGDFLRAERSPAAGAVRNDLEALIEKLSVPDLFQRPPFRLDIVVIVGDIGVLHIGPETDRVGEILPHAFILPDALLALLDERLHPVSFDLLFAVQAQFLLDLQLNRQTVRIPSGFPGHILSLHGMIARDHILDDARQHMSDMRLAVGCRRAVIKGIIGRAFPLLHTLLENVFLLPEVIYLFLPVHKVQVSVHFIIKHNRLLHGPPFSSVRAESAASGIPGGLSFRIIKICIRRSGILYRPGYPR